MSFGPFIQVGAVVTITAGWVAYATYLERKISAFMQARLGPMRVGPWGLLQPIADGLKITGEGDFIPENADRWIFFLAPYIAVVAAFIVMAVVSVRTGLGRNYPTSTSGILFVLAVSSVGVLALILAGWFVKLEVRFAGGFAFERADGFVRSLDGPGDHRRFDVRAHVVTLGHRSCTAI